MIWKYNEQTDTLYVMKKSIKDMDLLELEYALLHLEKSEDLPSVPICIVKNYIKAKKNEPNKTSGIEAQERELWDIRTKRKEILGKRQVDFDAIKHDDPDIDMVTLKWRAAEKNVDMAEEALIEFYMKHEDM